MYEQVAERYVLDDDVRRVHAPLEPVGRCAAIAERLLEAAERGLWASPEPDDARRRSATRYLALEGELEEAGA